MLLNRNFWWLYTHLSCSTNKSWADQNKHFFLGFLAFKKTIFIDSSMDYCWFFSVKIIESNGNSAFFFRSIVSSCHVSNDFTETISNTYIIHRTELKTSVIRKPVLRFKNRWQVWTNYFLRGLIWYAWFLWEAFRSKVRKFW